MPTGIKWNKWDYNKKKDVRTRTGKAAGVRGVGMETQWKRDGRWRRFGH